MKTLRLLVVTTLFITVVTSMTNAQSAKDADQSGPGKTAQSEREKIKKEQLPAAAVTLLESSAFKGWTVVQAYRIKVKGSQNKEKPEYEYEVEVKKDNLVQVLKFDKDGAPK
jgi:hypothetical protein